MLHLIYGTSLNNVTETFLNKMKFIFYGLKDTFSVDVVFCHPKTTFVLIHEDFPLFPLFTVSYLHLIFCFHFFIYVIPRVLNNRTMSH